MIPNLPTGSDSRLVNILVILIVAILFWFLVQLLSKSLVNALSMGTPRGKRLRTLSSIVKNTLSVLIFVFVIIEVLSQFGVSLAPIIASASIIGLAVGFGAQTLVKDVISGFFLLAEDQFDEGDEIAINDKRGEVEKITLRTVWLARQGRCSAHHSQWLDHSGFQLLTQEESKQSRRTGHWGKGRLK